MADRSYDVGINVNARTNLRPFEQMQTAISRIERATREANEEFRRWEQQTREQVDEMRRLDRETDKVVSSQQGLSSATTQVRDSMQDSRKTQANVDAQAIADANRRKFAIQSVAIAGVGLLISELGRLAKESITAYAEFDTSIRQVATLTRTGSEGIQRMTDDAIRLAKEMRVSPGEIALAQYQAESLQAADSMEALAIAHKASIAGATDLEGALNAGLKTLNAYEQGTYTLEQIYDIFFTTIDLGAIRMEDLARGISEVTSVAGESGTRLEDVAAALVVMTRQGDDFNEAIELSSLLLQQLGTGGTAAATAFVDATGISYRQFIAEGGNLVEALAIMEKAALRTGKTIGEMLAGSSPFYRDTQAARAAAELTGFHLDEMRDAIEEMGAAAGRMEEAYSIASEGAQRDLDDLAASWDILKIRFGEFIASLDFLREGLRDLADGFYFLSRGYHRDAAIMIEDNKLQAFTLGEFRREAQLLVDLQKTYDSQLFQGDLLNPGQKQTRERIREIVELQAELSSNYRELRGRLIDAFGEENVRLTNYSTEILGYEFGAAQDIFSSGQQRIRDEVQATADEINRMADAIGKSDPNYFPNLEKELGMIRQNIEGLPAVAKRAFSEINLIGSEDILADPIRDSIQESLDNVTKIREINLSDVIALDGDTLRVRIKGVIEDIRLPAIDTPETAKDFLGKESQFLGDKALEFTQQFILDPDLIVRTDGTRGVYGRLIGAIFNGEGQNLSEELVRAGLALPMPVSVTGDEQLTARMQQLAEEAAQIGLGVFEDANIASAFLSGRIASNEELNAYLDELDKIEKEHYAQFSKYLGQAQKDAESASAAFRAAAFEKLLVAAGSENYNAVLQWGEAIGLLEEGEADRRALYAETLSLVDEASSLLRDEAIPANNDLFESIALIETGLFDTFEQAFALAEYLTDDSVQAFVDSAGAGDDLIDVLDNIGLAIENIPSEKRIKFISDTSQWNPPTEPPGGWPEGGGRFAHGGLVTGGITGQDSVPSLLMPGEFVIREQAARALGYDLLSRLNAVNGSSGGAASGRLAGNQSISVNAPITINGNPDNDTIQRIQEGVELGIIRAAQQVGFRL